MKTLTMIFILLGFTQVMAQTRLRVMSYNVENLLDTIDNPSKMDEEFTPDGTRHWNSARYWRKQRHVAKVITAAGGWEAPAIVALCEVENDSVLRDLTRRTPLRQDDYRYVITHGPDLRGINVALLYQRDRFRLLGHESIPISFTGGRKRATRDILHLFGEVATHDTLDIFVCHFPSRYGGEKESEQNRIDAALRLKRAGDSIAAVRSRALIMIMGDFNDSPSDRSISQSLGAKAITSINATIECTETCYLNLIPRMDRGIAGSHKYQGQWSQLDQMIVNGNLLDQSYKVHIANGGAYLFAPNFILTEDKSWRGKRPLRTFHGYRYEGGFSDHLPIITELLINDSFR